MLAAGAVPKILHSNVKLQTRLSHLQQPSMRDEQQISQSEVTVGDKIRNHSDKICNYKLSSAAATEKKILIPS
jgi:hypothetical protein